MLFFIPGNAGSITYSESTQCCYSTHSSVVLCDVSHGISVFILLVLAPVSMHVLGGCLIDGI